MAAQRRCVHVGAPEELSLLPSGAQDGPRAADRHVRISRADSKDFGFYFQAQSLNNLLPLHHAPFRALEKKIWEFGCKDCCFQLSFEHTKLASPQLRLKHPASFFSCINLIVKTSFTAHWYHMLSDYVSVPCLIQHPEESNKDLVWKQHLCNLEGRLLVLYHVPGRAVNVPTSTRSETP